MAHSRHAYPCTLTVGDDGGIVVTFPDVPEAITGGDDRIEALAMAKDALATSLAGYVHQRRRIPRPGEGDGHGDFVTIDAGVATKLALYSTMLDKNISDGDLAVRLDISESAVRDLVNPDRRSQPRKVQRALEVAAGSSPAGSLSA